MSNEAPSSGFLHCVRVAVIGRNPKRTLVRLCALVVVCFVTFKFILLPVRVVGLSMEPTYRDGGWNFINRLAYFHGKPQRGNVVGVRMSTNLNAGVSIMLLKRVVGLPGETVSFAGGHLDINGVPQDEPYLKLPSEWQEDPKTLGPDEYYVVGDNRSMTPEEHTHGVAKRWQIVGKVLLRGQR